MAQRIVRFENGYRASVVDHGYYSDEGFYEVAVLNEFGLDYTTPITSDVVKRLDQTGVDAVLAQIAELPDFDSSMFVMAENACEADPALLGQALTTILDGLDRISKGLGKPFETTEENYNG